MSPLRSVVRAALPALTLMLALASAAPAAAAGWGPVRSLSTQAYAVPQRSVAVSGSTALVAYLQAGIRVRRSTNGGASWGPSKLIETTASSRQVSMPMIAMSGDHVVVLYHRQDSMATDFRYYVRRSSDGGLTWSSRILIAHSSSWMSLASASVAVTGASAVVAWTQGTSGAIRSRRSSDGGSHWGTARTLGSTNFQDSTYDGSVQVTASAGHVYVTWLPDQTTQGMAVGVAMRRSNDGGASFGPRTWLTADALHERGYVHIAASGARLVAVYQRAAGQLAEARSSNAGTTIHTQDLTNGASDPQTAVAISGASGRLAVVGYDGKLYLRSSSDGGAHWSTPSEAATPTDWAASLAVGVGSRGTLIEWQEAYLDWSPGATKSRFRS